MKKITIYIFVLAVVLFGDDVSSNKTIILPKPHDKTGHALDIMVKKDVIRVDYGKMLYMKHCASCHQVDRTGGNAPELSENTLQRYDTISQLYPVIARGCPESKAERFDKLGSVKLIFISRHIKKQLKKK